MIEMPYDEAVFVLFRSRRSAPRYSRRTRSRASSPLAAASRAGAAPCPCDAVRSIPLIRQCPESPAAGCSWGDERPELTHTGYRSKSNPTRSLTLTLTETWPGFRWRSGLGVKSTPTDTVCFCGRAGAREVSWRSRGSFVYPRSYATRARSSLRRQTKYKSSLSSSARLRSASPDAARCPPHLAKLRAHSPRL